MKDLGIPCINYGELHSKYGFEANPEKHFLKCVDENYLNSSINSLLKRGDFVFADTSEDIEGSGNFTCLDSDIPTFAGYHTIIARPKYDYNYRFIAYFFDSLEYRTQIQREVVGIKVFSITQTILKNTNLILPTVQEQTTIASFLDRKTAEIDHIIANKQKLIALYEEEKQAIINQAVTKGLDPNVKMKDSGVEWLGEIPEGWVVKKLKYFVNLITEKANGDNSKIGLENIESKTGKYIETNTNFEGEGIAFIKNDILYGKLRPYLAKVWVAEFEGAAVGDFFVIRMKEDLYSEFMKYRLLSSSFTDVSNGSTFGAKMPRVSWDFMSDLFFATPSINEQQSIVAHIERECSRLDAIISKFNKQIDLLQEYRTTLISEVVTGKIKVCE